jgi:hypothetical protein
MESENKYCADELNENVAVTRLEKKKIRDTLNEATTPASVVNYEHVSRSPIGYRKDITMVGKTRPKKDRYSGYIIVRLSAKIYSLKGDDLQQVAKEQELENLVRLLEEYKSFQIKSTRLIHSLPLQEIRDLERKAATTDFPPLHSLTSYWRLDTRRLSETESERFVRLLNELSEIDLAYREMSGGDPVINDADDPYAASQDYLDAAPVGIDARWVWTQNGAGEDVGAGKDVGLMDLEQGWFLNHEDLIAKNPTIVYNDNRDGQILPDGVTIYKGGHGTAVLGEIVGVDNTVGIVGIAPAVESIRMVSHYRASDNSDSHVADAILAAIPLMPVGDVLLIEFQRSNQLLPTEVDPADFDAIRLAVANGIIVLEIAGNGNNDLDTWTDQMGNMMLNRGSPQFLDSGAIMVGAAISLVPHDRIGFSNFGSRIDCYAWGENVVTAGGVPPGDLDPGTGDNNTYTATFTGTSASTPIITGAAILLQAMYKAIAGTPLSPGQMRLLLSNPSTGTPQGPNVSGNIGVMPNLRAIIEDTLNLVTDVYLRDNIGDNGSVPTVGPISSSPDVIVVPNLVADPVASFGPSTENSNTLGSEVKKGQANYIYVRMKNRGTTAASNVTATV